MGKFIITKRTNGEYQFSLLAGNGQIILLSELYTQKAGCINGIKAVVKYSQDETKFERKTASNGKYYFNLKAANGAIIGTSQMYESEAARENGIYSTSINAKENKIEEQ